MEYERAIFRVYERCMEGLRDESEPGSVKYCRMLELITLTFALFLLVALISLHITFVSGNQDGCLRQLLLEQNVTSLGRDQILYINVDPMFSPDRSGSFLRNGNDDRNGDDYAINPAGHYESFASYVSQNIFIKPLLDLVPRQLSSRVLEKVNSRRRLYSRDSKSTITTRNEPFYNRLFSILSNGTSNMTLPPEGHNYTLYDYEFSYETAILALPMRMREVHSFPSINVTLSGPQCFGGAYIQSLLPLGGIDAVVLNNIIQFTQVSGSLASYMGDFYAWSETSIIPYDNFVSFVAFKLSVLTQSCFCFFLLSTTTALLIRILISSGVVLLFPIFSLMQVCNNIFIMLIFMLLDDRIINNIKYKSHCHCRIALIHVNHLTAITWLLYD